MQSERRSEEHKQELVPIFSKLPESSIQVTEQAFRLATDKVSESDWNTPWLETPAARFLILFLPLNALLFLLPENLSAAGSLILTLVVGPFFLLALARLSFRALSQRKKGLNPRPSLLVLSLSFLAFVLVLISPYLIQKTSQKMVSRARDTATTVSALQFISQLQMATESYFEYYGALPEFPAHFKSNTPEGGQLIQILTGSPQSKEENPRLIAFLPPRLFNDESTSSSVFEHGFTDSFGTPYEIFLNTQYQRPFKFQHQGKKYQTTHMVGIISAGKDLTFGTKDDLVILSPVRP